MRPRVERSASWHRSHLTQAPFRERPRWSLAKLRQLMAGNRDLLAKEAIEPGEADDSMQPHSSEVLLTSMLVEGEEEAAVERDESVRFAPEHSTLRAGLWRGEEAGSGEAQRGGGGESESDTAEGRLDGPPCRHVSGDSPGEGDAWRFEILQVSSRLSRTPRAHLAAERFSIRPYNVSLLRTRLVLQDAAGRTYYHDRWAGTTQWEAPPRMLVTPLPPELLALGASSFGASAPREAPLSSGVSRASPSATGLRSETLRPREDAMREEHKGRRGERGNGAQVSLQEQIRRGTKLKAVLPKAATATLDRVQAGDDGMESAAATSMHVDGDGMRAAEESPAAVETGSMLLCEVRLKAQKLAERRRASATGAGNDDKLLITSTSASSTTATAESLAETAAFESPPPATGLSQLGESAWRGSGHSHRKLSCGGAGSTLEFSKRMAPQRRRSGLTSTRRKSSSSASVGGQRRKSMFQRIMGGLGGESDASGAMEMASQVEQVDAGTSASRPMSFLEQIKNGKNLRRISLSSRAALGTKGAPAAGGMTLSNMVCPAPEV